MRILMDTESIRGASGACHRTTWGRRWSEWVQPSGSDAEHSEGQERQAVGVDTLLGIWPFMGQGERPGGNYRLDGGSFKWGLEACS